MFVVVLVLVVGVLTLFFVFYRGMCMYVYGAVGIAAGVARGGRNNVRKMMVLVEGQNEDEKGNAATWWLLCLRAWLYWMD